MSVARGGRALCLSVDGSLRLRQLAFRLVRALYSVDHELAAVQPDRDRHEAGRAELRAVDDVRLLDRTLALGDLGRRLSPRQCALARRQRCAGLRSVAATDVESVYRLDDRGPLRRASRASRDRRLDLVV